MVAGDKMKKFERFWHIRLYMSFFFCIFAHFLCAGKRGGCWKVSDVRDKRGCCRKYATKRENVMSASLCRAGNENNRDDIPRN